MLVQILEEEETVTNADMVISVQRWRPVAGKITRPSDLVVPKRVVSGRLCALLARKFAIGDAARPPTPTTTTRKEGEGEEGENAKSKEKEKEKGVGEQSPFVPPTVEELEGGSAGILVSRAASFGPKINSKTVKKVTFFDICAPEPGATVGAFVACPCPFPFCCCCCCCCCCCRSFSSFCSHSSHPRSRARHRPRHVISRQGSRRHRHRRLRRARVRRVERKRGCRYG